MSNFLDATASCYNPFGIITSLGASGGSSASPGITGGMTSGGGTFIGQVVFGSTTDSTSLSTGSVIVNGGLAIQKNITALSQHITSTTQSTGATIGALIVDGGIGVAKNIISGGNITGSNMVASTGVFSDNYDVVNVGDSMTIGPNANIVHLAYLNPGSSTIAYSRNISFPNRPSFSVTPSGTQSSAVTGSFVTVNWGTKLLDVGSNFSGGVFTAPYAGLYQFGVRNFITGSSGTSQFIMSFVSTPFSEIRYFQGSVASNLAGVQFTCNGSVILQLAAGNTVSVQFFQVGNSGNSSLSGGMALANFWGTMIG